MVRVVLRELTITNIYPIVRRLTNTKVTIIKVNNNFGSFINEL